MDADIDDGNLHTLVAIEMVTIRLTRLHYRRTHLVRKAAVVVVVAVAVVR